MAQYAPPPMGRRRSQSMVDLILRRGDIQGRAAMGSGAIWGQTIANVGNSIGQGLDQRNQRKSQEERSKGINEAVQGWDGKDLRALHRSFSLFMPPEEALKATTAFGTLETTAAKLQKGETPDIASTKMQIQGIVALERAGPGYIEQNYPEIVKWVGPGAAAHMGWQPSEQWNSRVNEEAFALNDSWEKDPGTRAVTTRNPDGSETQQIVPDTPGQTFESAAPQPAPRVPLGTIEAEAAAAARGRTAGSPPPPPKSLWSKPYIDADGVSRQYNETDGSVRDTPGGGRKPEAGTTAGQRAQAQQKVNTVLGSPESKDPDAIYSIVMRNTLPGDVGLLGTATGVGATLQMWSRMGAQRGDLELYESQKEGFVPLLARAVGHTGVLTEKDVERTLMLLPVLSGLYADTQVTAKRKLDRLRRIMSGDEKIPDGLWQGEEGSAAVGQTVGNFTVTEVR